MSTRVQVIMADEEKELFQYRANREGLSLSSWLRKAGQEMLRRQAPVTTEEELARFFAACDAREKGIEPDWNEHLATIERSRRSGIAES